ncbi:MAG: hypothetical protein QM330_07440 [Acidobacteriota bacterium]|jgi:YHS domain-containing protein|nr:hypothetical protein [Acidobacteriota bacterium]NLT33826.1 YHS domain-containing protein [Acidobacteriota bacterium]
MVALISRILIFVLGIWFLRRLFLSLGAPPKPGAQRGAAKPSNAMVRDPVCGMYMDPRLALRLEEGKGTFFFCSEECKGKFLAGVRAGAHFP